MKENILTILEILALIIANITLITNLFFIKKYSYIISVITNYFCNFVLICLIGILYIKPTLWLVIFIYIIIMLTMFIRHIEIEIKHNFQNLLEEYKK